MAFQLYRPRQLYRVHLTTYRCFVAQSYSRSCTFLEPLIIILGTRFRCRARLSRRRRFSYCFLLQRNASCNGVSSALSHTAITKEMEMVQSPLSSTCAVTVHGCIKQVKLRLMRQERQGPLQTSPYRVRRTWVALVSTTGKVVFRNTSTATFYITSPSTAAHLFSSTPPESTAARLFVSFPYDTRRVYLLHTTLRTPRELRPHLFLALKANSLRETTPHTHTHNGAKLTERQPALDMVDRLLPSHGPCRRSDAG
jgi:hypothetical protein